MQGTNVLMLAFWTYNLFDNYEQYQHQPELEGLRLLGEVYYWGWFTLLVCLMCALPMTPWWARYINSVYLLKRVGLLLSVMWWAFLGTMFYLVGVPLGTGIHVILALGCTFESMRLIGER